MKVPWNWRRAEDTLGGQIGKVGLGWILKAVPAVLKSFPCGWACWPCGCCCTTVLLPSEYLFISLSMIFPALNPHSDYIPWGRDQVGIVHCSIPHTWCPAQSRCLVNPGCLDEGMYISFYLWVMVCHCRFTVWDWDSMVMCLRRSVVVCMFEEVSPSVQHELESGRYEDCGEGLRYSLFLCIFFKKVANPSK